MKVESSGTRIESLGLIWQVAGGKIHSRAACKGFVEDTGLLSHAVQRLPELSEPMYKERMRAFTNSVIARTLENSRCCSTCMDLAMQSHMNELTLAGHSASWCRRIRMKVQEKRTKLNILT